MSVVVLGPFHIDLVSGEVRRDGIRLRFLPKRLVQVLKLLIEADNFVSREDLTAALQLESRTDRNHAVDVAIADLRAVLGDSAKRSRFVERIPFRGYRLVTAVREVPAPNLIRGLPEYAIEVAPFEILPSESRHHWSRLISEEIFTALVKCGFRTSNDHHPRGPHVLAIEGAVHLVEGRARVNSSLRVSAGTIHRLAFDLAIDEDLSTILRIAREIAHKTTSIIQADFAAQRDNLLLTLLREGEHHWGRRTGEGFLHAVDAYHRAASQFPEDPRPYQGLAMSYLMLAVYGIRAVADLLPDFYRANMMATSFGGARSLLEVNEAHAMHIFEGRYRAAERMLRRAVIEAPNLVPAYNALCMLYTSQGRRAEALRTLEESARIDSLWPTLHALETFTHFCSRDYVSAIAAGQRAIADHPYQHLGRAYFAQALEFVGRMEEAIEQHKICCAHSPDIPWLIALRGCCEAKAGHTDLAQQSLNEVREQSSTRYVDRYYIAVLLAALGRKNDGIAELDRAVDELSATTFILDVDPKLDALRTHPRFAGVRQKWLARGKRVRQLVRAAASERHVVEKPKPTR
ncbi:MAG: winged helix-turn-helix domain-containing protein [Bryobacteraceae bacterium]